MSARVYGGGSETLRIGLPGERRLPVLMSIGLGRQQVGSESKNAEKTGETDWSSSLWM